VSDLGHLALSKQKYYSRAAADHRSIIFTIVIFILVHIPGTILANLFELRLHQDSFKSQNREKKAATHNNHRSIVFQLQLWLQPPLYSILSSTGIAPKPQQWCYLPHLNFSFFLIIFFLTWKFYWRSLIH
jgi:hypothetical protein